MKLQTLPGGTYKIAYTTDSANTVTAAELTDRNNFVRRVEFDAAGFLVTDTAAYGTSPGRSDFRIFRIAVCWLHVEHPA